MMFETLVLSAFGALSVSAAFAQRIVSRKIGDGDKANYKRPETKTKALKTLQWRFFGAYFLAILGEKR